MKLKIYIVLGLVFFLSSCCKKDKNEVLSQRFVHKYGFNISENEWDARNKNGKVISILKNGVTKIAHYKDAILHGFTTLTFPHSAIIQEKHEYNEGSLVKKITYDLSGLPMKEYAFDLENKKTITIWDKNGVPLRMEEYNNKDLLWSARYYNSKNEIEATITEGNGIRIKRDRNGVLLAEEKVKKGKIVNRKTYHQNGHIKSEVSFLDYQLHGEQKSYSTNGKLISKSNWNLGNLDGLKICYRNDKKYLEIPYKNGKKHGLEKEYNFDGELAKEINYENDIRHGSARYYFDDYTDIEWYWKGMAVNLKRFQALEFREELLAEINADKTSTLDKMIDKKATK